MVEGYRFTIKPCLCLSGFLVYATACFFLWSFCIAGSDFVHLLEGKEFVAMKDTPKNANGFLLFPGVKNMAYFDVLYIIVTAAILFGFGLAFGIEGIFGGIRHAFGEEEGYKRGKAFMQLGCWVLFVGAAIPFLFHGFGNLHYALWCGADVLSAQNCEMMPAYNLYTFASGPFFLYFPLLLAGLIWCCFHLFFVPKWAERV